MNISKALVYYCNQQDLKQNELAEMSGLSCPHLNQIYKGAVKNPKVHSIYLICKALDISMDEFMHTASRFN